MAHPGQALRKQWPLSETARAKRRNFKNCPLQVVGKEVRELRMVAVAEAVLLMISITRVAIYKVLTMC